MLLLHVSGFVCSRLKSSFWFYLLSFTVIEPLTDVGFPVKQNVLRTLVTLKSSCECVSLKVSFVRNLYF